MKCPHCLESFNEIVHQTHDVDVGLEADARWRFVSIKCPSCDRFVMYLRKGVHEKIMVWPRGIARSPLPTDVPEEFATDYKEACLVFSDSPKASAALSRRCLQHLLREKGEVKASNLYNEITQVIDSGKLPSDLADGLHVVREIGNFAAHPIKSLSTGEIVPVEPGEAEWNLDMLESLFDFYFVRPAKLKKSKEDINKKLLDAGKKPIE